MCKESYDIFWCEAGQHQIGDPIIARRYTCSEADSVGFGACGKVMKGRPSQFFVKCCDDCAMEKKARKIRTTSKKKNKPAATMDK